MFSDVREKLFRVISNGSSDEVIKIICTMTLIDVDYEKNVYTFADSEKTITAVVSFTDKKINICYADQNCPFGMAHIERDLIVDGSPFIPLLTNKCRGFNISNFNNLEDAFDMIERLNRDFSYSDCRDEVLTLRKDLWR